MRGIKDPGVSAIDHDATPQDEAAAVPALNPAAPLKRKDSGSGEEVAKGSGSRDDQAKPRGSSRKRKKPFVL